MNYKRGLFRMWIVASLLSAAVLWMHLIGKSNELVRKGFGPIDWLDMLGGWAAFSILLSIVIGTILFAIAFIIGGFATKR